MFSLVFSAISLTGFIVGFRINPYIGQLIFSCVLISIIQFFRNFLNILSKNTNKIVNGLVFSHFLIIIYYLIRSFEFPNSSYFTNLEEYPIQPLGIGYARIVIQFIPTITLLFYFVFLSLKSWRSGDKASGYIVFALTIPAIAFGFTAVIINLANKGYLGLEMINLVALPLGGILLILCPIIINLALEERIKTFKDDALNKLKILNLELDERVKERKAELEKANNLITDSIQSTSAIRSAVLPNI